MRRSQRLPKPVRDDIEKLAAEILQRGRCVVFTPASVDVDEVVGRFAVAVADPGDKPFLRFLNPEYGAVAPAIVRAALATELRRRDCEVYEPLTKSEMEEVCATLWPQWVKSVARPGGQRH